MVRGSTRGQLVYKPNQSKIDSYLELPSRFPRGHAGLEKRLGKTRTLCVRAIRYTFIFGLKNIYSQPFELSFSRALDTYSVT